MDAQGIEQGLINAVDRLADAVEHELRLEDGRAAAKQEAISRLMQGPNPLTGKAHSASSAEAVVETDAQYAAYREQQYAARRATMKAEAYRDVWRFRARMAAGYAEVLS
jgi:hypothetical protein